MQHEVGNYCLLVGFRGDIVCNSLKLRDSTGRCDLVEEYEILDFPSGVSIHRINEDKGLVLVGGRV